MIDAPAPATVSARWLPVLRAGWIAVALGALGIWIAGMPLYYHRLLTFTNTDGFIHRTPAIWRQGLHQLGLSPQFYAGFLLAVEMSSLLLVAMGLLLFVRRANERMALLLSLTLVTFGLSTAGAGQALQDTYPQWKLPIEAVGDLGFTTFFLLPFLFPSGRFVPRWTRRVAVLWIYMSESASLLAHTVFDINRWPGLVIGPLTILVFLSALYAPIYRYRRTADSVQRQQMKWAAAGLLIPLALFPLVEVVRVVDPSLVSTPSAKVLYDMVSLGGIVLAFSCTPLFFAVAIFRYRLWDIDVLVNRTLVYGSLTLSLGALYIGGVIVLQALFRTFSGQSSNAAVAISTLAIAALFQPLRHRLQSGINRRFYRHKYDAGRTLVRFGAQLRDEVDIEHLSAGLVSVVNETMQPAHVSLWLRRDRFERSVKG